MIPIRDNIPPRSFPFVNCTLIAICVAVFAMQLMQGRGGREATLIERYGMIPSRVLRPERDVFAPEARRIWTPLGPRVQVVERPMAEPPFRAKKWPGGNWWTLLTCVFLHGGWLHIIGNMWFLRIFGDNVEDRLGHFKYLLFYLLCGALASLAHLATHPTSDVPTVGASGAIAGVMGAYLLLYPHAKILSAIPIFYFIEMVVLPAPFFLVVWLVIQLFQGALTVTSLDTGVAWWAHIGGFIVGAAIVALLRGAKLIKPPVLERLPRTERVGAFRLRR